MKKFRGIFSLLMVVVLFVTSLPLVSVNASDNMQEIFVGNSYQVTVDKSGEFVLFIPQKDGWYEISSWSDGCLPEATLYNSNMEELDCETEWYDNDFHIKAKLFAGNTYYLELKAELQTMETATYEVYVEEVVSVQNVKVVKEPVDTTFVEDYATETFSYEGLELEFELSDGTKIPWSYDKGGWIGGISIDAEVYIYLRNDNIGNYYIEIICEDASAKIPYTVIETPVDYIQYNGPSFEFYENPHSYYVYEMPKDAEIIIHYKDGSSVTGTLSTRFPEGYIKCFDEQYKESWEVGGDNYITLSYLGVEHHIPVTIKPYPVASITVNSSPTKEYILGDLRYGSENRNGTYHITEFDFTGISFTVEFLDGTSKTYTEKDIDMEHGMIDGAPFETSGVSCVVAGIKSLRIWYKGHYFSVDVKVVDSPVASIEVVSDPYKVVYEEYYYPTFDGTEVKVTYTDGTSETIVLSEENTVFKHSSSKGIWYEVTFGEMILYITKDYDGNYRFKCFTTETEYAGIETIPTVWCDTFTVTQISPDYVDAVVDITYTDGTKETLEFKSIAKYYDEDYFYNNFSRLEKGIGAYGIDTNIENGEVTSYTFRFLSLGWSFELFIPTTPDVTIEPTETIAATETTVEVSLSTDSTESSTNTEVTVSDITTEPTEEMGILGDVNGDGKVNIKDATLIQKAAAKLIDLTDDEKLRADVNADNKNNVKDATAIQKFVAKIETGFPIGESIVKKVNS